MANISGTNVAAKIAPFTTDDNYATHDAIYGKGGAKEVATIAERDAIPTERLTEGCTCYVVADGKTYRWLNSAWVDDTPADGKSAYELYVEGVPEGETPMTEEAWLASLKGDKGDDGDSAYEVYVASVPEGEVPLSKSAWLASLVGPQGPQGNTVILGDEDTYTLYNSTGQNTNGAMTQKAVTDLIAEVSADVDSAMAETVKKSDLSLKNVEDGGFTTTGGISDSDWCHNTEFIPVQSGDTIRWRAGEALSSNTDKQKNSLCFYNANKVLLNYIGYNATDREYNVDGVPNTAYIRASFRKVNGYGIDIKKSGETAFTNVFSVISQDGEFSDISKVPILEESIEAVEQEVEELKQQVILDKNVNDGGFRYSDGAVMDNDWCHAIDYIEVNEGDVITWRAGSVIPSYRDDKALVMYNSNKVYQDYAGYNAVDRQITIGSGVKYVRPSFPKADGYTLEVNGVVVLTTVVETVNKVQKALNDSQEAVEGVETLEGKLTNYTDSYRRLGCYLNNQGGLVDDDDWAVSVDIPCQYQDSIQITVPSDITDQSTPKRYLCFYDANGTFLNYYLLYGRTATLSHATLVNCAFLRLSVRLADAELFTLQVNDELKYTGFEFDKSTNVFATIEKIVQANIPENNSGNGASSNTSYIPLCGFEQKDVGSNFSTSASNKAVCTSAMLIPYVGVKFHFEMPETIGCKVQYGTIISGTSTDCTIQESEELEGIAFTKRNVRFAFRKIDNSDVTPSEIQTLVDEGRVSISYENQTPNVVAKNIGSEVFAKAVMYREARSTGDANSYLHNLPVFAHFSDLHGDVVRLKNMMEYCKYLGVDAVINTGDTACNKAIDGSSTYHAIVGSVDYDFPTLLCVGNHDAWLQDDPTQGTHNAKLYANFIQPNSTKFGYTLPAATDYDDGATYYYRDFTSQKIRVISVNLYEQGLRTWSLYGRISKKQIDWLIATLAATPANYGVIIMEHVHTANIVKDTNYSEFYDKVRTITTDPNLTGDPIGKIVDAFISGVLYSGSYTQLLENDGSETIEYTADFTNLNSNVEFICYMNGHHHSDYVGYQNGTTNRQLVLNITTAQSIYGTASHPYKANSGDLPRGGQGACEDAFNVYGIDRTAGTVRIARVGANMTSSLQKREVMVIPYK